MKKIIVSAIISLALLASITTMAFAAIPTLVTGYWQANIPLDTTTNVATSYNDSVNAAITYWNTKNSGRYVYSSLNSTNKIITVYENNNVYGGYSRIQQNTALSKNQVTQFTISLNGYLLSTATSLTKRSTMAHELGHAFGLGENNTLSTYLMNQTRNRNQVYVPTTEEVSAAISMNP